MMEGEATTVVLGVDGGGSRTRAILMGQDRKVLSRGEGGASNHQSVGEGAARKGLAEAIGTALAAASGVHPSYACWGMAGLDREEDKAFLEHMADEITPGVPTRIVHDATIALAGGTGGKREGVVIVAGTGSVIVGWHSDGRTARVGGWGHMLGDEGSGYAIAREGLNRATLALDGRAPCSRLPEAFARAAGVESFQTLASRLYLETWRAPQLAALAPVVIQAATDGDAVAATVIEHASGELAQGAVTVIRRLGMETAEFEVILAGGVFEGSECMQAQVAEVIRRTAPGAVVRLPRAEAVLGAGLLALHFLQESKRDG